MTAWWEHEFNRTRVAEFDLSLVERVLIAGRALWFQAFNLVWPSNLTFSYPAGGSTPVPSWQYLYPLGVAAALAVACSGAAAPGRRSRLCCFFCVSLGPTLAFSISTPSGTPSSPTTTNMSPASDC
jgi:hypothetical protein